MRFHAGDDVTIPIRELAGAENADEERRAKPCSLTHAALKRLSLKRSDPSCRSRSAASWHLMQSRAHGTAARRLGLIVVSHSEQVPKLPSRIRRKAALTSRSRAVSRSTLRIARSRSEAY